MKLSFSSKEPRYINDQLYDSDLVTVLRRASTLAPTKGIHLFRDGRRHEDLTYDSLYASSGGIACSLMNSVNNIAGARIALFMPFGADCIRAFFGILAAGAVPVPLPGPQHFTRPDRFAERIRGALRQSQVKYIVSGDKLLSFLEKTLLSLEHPPRVYSITSLLNQTACWNTPSSGDIALVQYTSGSTASPKGVLLTHAQIVANISAIARCIELGPDDVGCSWLPLFHDMGLIGCLLTATYSMIDLLLMAPEEFMVNPSAWLQLISNQGATICTAPSSAYALCAQKVDPLNTTPLNLEAWRVAMNGSEMINASSTRMFVKKFGMVGFRKEAMLPVYGLAEASLAVTFSPLGRDMKTLSLGRNSLNRGFVMSADKENADLREVVSVGRPVINTAIRIYDETGLQLPDRVVGEIHVQGQSVMMGYEGDRSATDSAFRRRNWLRTGDLGFMEDGELYVTGRLKDVLIVRGKNYYAHDVEMLVSRIEGVWMQNTMAISVQADLTEELVVMVESRLRTEDQHCAMKAAIRESVSNTLGISPSDIVIVKPGELPRTSSGKLERFKASALYRSRC